MSKIGSTNTIGYYDRLNVNPTADSATNFVIRKVNGTATITMGTMPGDSAYSGMWFTPVSGIPTAANYTLLTDAAGNFVRLGVPSGGPLQLYFANSVRGFQFSEAGNVIDANTTFGALVSGNGRGLTNINSTNIVGDLIITTPPAGSIGEFVGSTIGSGSAVSLSGGVAANVTSISLTAGDWDVQGSIIFSPSTATVTSEIGSLSTTSATQLSDGTQVYSGVGFTLASTLNSVTLPRKRIWISSTTTVYLVGTCTFSAGTVTAYGQMTARRVR